MSRPAPRRTAALRQLAAVVPVFAALGDTTRLALVGRLSRDGPLSITRLTDGAGMTRQAVTKHLLVLSEAGLVRGTRHGRESQWTLDAEPLQEARRSLDLLSAQWDVALSRLKDLVEEGSVPHRSRT
jgi:DNA-binding transcriptional ArsR family regulator